MRFVVLVALAASLQLSPSYAADRQTDQEALKPFGGFVGDWRGVGQLERGKTKGAWRESANWAWKLSKDSAALAMTVEKGKYLKSALLKPGNAPGAYVLEAVLADGTSRVFQGKATDPTQPLILEASGKTTGLRRIKFTPLHETRLLMLLEASNEGDSKSLARLGEVGFTREGVAFASGDGAPVCIVTEGRGSSKVTYQGKTYWVCCSGCKDLFDDNPEAVLAEAEARKKAKGAK